MLISKRVVSQGKARDRCVYVVCMLTYWGQGNIATILQITLKPIFSNVSCILFKYLLCVLLWINWLINVQMMTWHGTEDKPLSEFTETRWALATQDPVRNQQTRRYYSLLYLKNSHRLSDIWSKAMHLSAINTQTTFAYPLFKRLPIKCPHHIHISGDSIDIYFSVSTRTMSASGRCWLISTGIIPPSTFE